MYLLKYKMCLLKYKGKFQETLARNILSFFFQKNVSIFVEIQR